MGETTKGVDLIPEPREVEWGRRLEEGKHRNEITQWLSGGENGLKTGAREEGGRLDGCLMQIQERTPTSNPSPSRRDR